MQIAYGDLEKLVGRNFHVVPGTASSMPYFKGRIGKKDGLVVLWYETQNGRKHYKIEKGDGIHSDDMRQFLGWVV